MTSIRSANWSLQAISKNRGWKSLCKLIKSWHVFASIPHSSSSYCSNLYCICHQKSFSVVCKPQRCCKRRHIACTLKHVSLYTVLQAKVNCKSVIWEIEFSVQKLVAGMQQYYTLTAINSCEFQYIWNRSCYRFETPFFWLWAPVLSTLFITIQLKGTNQNLPNHSNLTHCVFTCESIFWSNCIW